MCRSIKRLREPHGAGHATDEEIREAALQFVRKVSGFQAPSLDTRRRSRGGRRGGRSSKRLLETIEATPAERA